MKSDEESKCISTLPQLGGIHSQEVLAAEIARLVTACKGFFELSAAEAPRSIWDENLFSVMV